MTDLERFAKGFPDLHWALYFDNKLGKDTIMSIQSGLQFEMMPRGKRFVKRYKLKSI